VAPFNLENTCIYVTISQKVSNPNAINDNTGLSYPARLTEGKSTQRHSGSKHES